MSATDDINEGGRTSSSNNGVDDNNSPSAVRITLQVDNTSALPLFLQGRTVAIRGGDLDRYTVDAQEPIKRKQIHTNIKHTRLLRASLEDAAAKVEALSSSTSTTTSKSAYTKAMNILRSSLPQIHQLEALTQSLEGGGYGNNNRSNNKNTVSSKVEVDKDKDQMLREQRIIRQHLLEFVRESNPAAKIDNDKEEYHGLLTGDGMSMIPESNDTAIMKENPVLGRGSVAIVPKRDTISTTTNKASFERGSSYSSEDRQRKRSKNDSINKLSGMDRVQGKKKSSSKMPAATVAAARKDSQGIRSSGTGSASMTSIIARPPSTTNSHTSNSNTNASTESAAAATSAPAKKPRPTPAVPKKAPKPRSVKKCHDCKSVTNRHRVCSYWNLKGLTGSKCGKVFCLECLQSKYTVGDDVRGSNDDNERPGPSSSNISACAKSTIEDIMQNPALDSEWHCPSCLGTCQCNTCVVQRKRDEEREMNRLEGERKSKRRTAAHSSYYNFF